MSNMIYGKYRILIDGEIAAEADNVITTHGKREILNILAGRSMVPSTIVYGVGNTAATSNDTTLDVPVGRVGITFATPIYDAGTPAQSKVVYKGRLSDSTYAEIHEIGLSTFQSELTQLVTPFDSTESISGTSGGSVPAFDETSHRIGLGAAAVEVGETMLLSKSLQIGTGSITDDVVLAGWSDTSSTVTLTLTDSNGNTAVDTFALTSTYSGPSNKVSAFTLTGAFNWADVVSVQATTTGDTAYLDGLTIKSESLYGGLFSRAVYSPDPVIKRPGSRMDIEYELGIDLT